jgi:hypothetical protein
MTRIQLRRDTAANWTTANPVLAPGEAGVELDTGKFKLGDGSTAWTPLAYAGGSPPAAKVEALSDAATVTINVGNVAGYLDTLSQSTAFAHPSGTPSRMQSYTLRIRSTVVRALTWDPSFRGSALIPLPTATSGGGQTDWLSFVYHGTDLTFDLVGFAPGYGP